MDKCIFGFCKIAYWLVLIVVIYWISGILKSCQSVDKEIRKLVSDYTNTTYEAHKYGKRERTLEELYDEWKSRVSEAEEDLKIRLISVKCSQSEKERIYNEVLKIIKQKEKERYNENRIRAGALPIP